MPACVYRLTSRAPNTCKVVFGFGQRRFRCIHSEPLRLVWPLRTSGRCTLAAAQGGAKARVMDRALFACS